MFYFNRKDDDKNITMESILNVAKKKYKNKKKEMHNKMVKSILENMYPEKVKADKDTYERDPAAERAAKIAGDLKEVNKLDDLKDESYKVDELFPDVEKAIKTILEDDIDVPMDKMDEGGELKTKEEDIDISDEELNKEIESELKSILGEEYAGGMDSKVDDMGLTSDEVEDMKESTEGSVDEIASIMDSINKFVSESEEEQSETVPPEMYEAADLEMDLSNVDIPEEDELMKDEEISKMYTFEEEAIGNDEEGEIEVNIIEISPEDVEAGSSEELSEVGDTEGSSEMGEVFNEEDSDVEEIADEETQPEAAPEITAVSDELEKFISEMEEFDLGKEDIQI